MISRIIDDILSYSMETKTLIGVRKNSDGDSCWVGYILNFNDSLFVLQHISPLGMEDGIVIERIDNVDNFETEDNYVRAMQLILDQKAKISHQVLRSVEISTEENWQLEVLNSGFYEGKLITIEINNSDSVKYGFVLDFDDTSVQLTAIDHVGNEDGTQLFRLSDITSITVDRIEGRKREALYYWRQKTKNISKKK